MSPRALYLKPSHLFISSGKTSRFSISYSLSRHVFSTLRLALEACVGVFGLSCLGACFLLFCFIRPRRTALAGAMRIRAAAGIGQPVPRPSPELEPLKVRLSLALFDLGQIFSKDVGR